MIFILGGKGFVGSAFSQYCKENNIEHQVITRENYSDFIGKNCDILINSSGNSSKLLGKKDPLVDFERSVTSVKKTLYDFNFKKYVLLSSCDVYPDCSSPEKTREDSILDIEKQSQYGFHKYLAELCVISGCNNWLILRLGGMIGNGLKKNPIYDILHGGPLWVNTQSQLQFMNTIDVAKIIFSLIDKNISNNIFNSCGDGLVMIHDLLNRFGNVTISDNSSTVKYNVNIEKIKQIENLPNSEVSVNQFIEKYMENSS